MGRYFEFVTSVRNLEDDQVGTDGDFVLDDADRIGEDANHSTCCSV